MRSSVTRNKPPPSIANSGPEALRQAVQAHPRRWHQPHADGATNGVVALYKKAKAIAKEIDWKLEEAAVGGGSDGNFTAGIGIPTLDGMGGVGDGAQPFTNTLSSPNCRAERCSWPE